MTGSRVVEKRTEGNGSPAAQAVKGLTVVIPAFNEEAAIQQTVAELRKTLEGAKIDQVDIVVVDDGSQDATQSFADESGARVVRHPHNVGYGRSLKDGIRSARHDTIVIADGDGTYPVGAIPELLEMYGKGFDMVVGARTGDYYHGPFVKRALRIVLKFLVEFTAGRRVPDVNSGLRVFSRSTVIPYFPHLCEGFSFTTSLTLAYMMTSRFVVYVPIPYFERVGKTKVRLGRDALRTMQFIVEAIVYYNPIKLFVLISAGCGVVGVVALAVGFATGTLGLLVLGAVFVVLVVLVFCLGLLAVLLKQIMDKSTADDIRVP